MSEARSIYLYERCLAFAKDVHEGQVRKGKKSTFIEHPKAVVVLLSLVTKDPEIYSAGILHDTVEDCITYGSVTISIIAELAGERVARMVSDVTEPDRSLPWEARKQQALEHIAVMQQDSQLLKTGDILANLIELNTDLTLLPVDEVFSRFKIGKAKSIESYRKRYDALVARWPENPLLPQLKSQVEHLLTYI